VVKPTADIAFKQIDLKSLNISLEDLVTSSRQSIGVRGRSLEVGFDPGADQTDRLQQLHKLLIEPIAQYLPSDSSERVIFIPQNELFLVPFPALQDASGKYLIEKHTILIAPSIQVLQLTRKQRQTVSGDGALVIGNPTMPSVTTQLGEAPQPLSSLPGAQQEATEIAQLLNTKALIGKQATKAAVLPKLSNARIIHLATHGLLDDLKGLGVPGAIALAPDGTGELNDGLLTASEILDLNLNAELVVLSACDTGRGRITGDGVIGLSRSLITAGVPSVIVTLWSVPDAPTASLMTEFYQNLQKNPNKAQALRQAMLTTMKQHPNPRDWAAFTLIGEAQ
jgi:CHAT domain-containing protein